MSRIWQHGKLNVKIQIIAKWTRKSNAWHKLYESTYVWYSYILYFSSQKVVCHLKSKYLMYLCRLQYLHYDITNI